MIPMDINKEQTQHLGMLLENLFLVFRKLSKNKYVKSD